jgi:hypothetical protein
MATMMPELKHSALLLVVMLGAALALLLGAGLLADLP